MHKRFNMDTTFGTWEVTTEGDVEKKYFVIYQNTDMTEGRGFQYPAYAFTKEEDANEIAKGKGIMGTEATVRHETLGDYKTIVPVFSSAKEFEIYQGITKAIPLQIKAIVRHGHHY